MRWLILGRVLRLSLLLLSWPAVAAPTLSCSLEYNGEASVLAVPAQHDARASQRHDIGRFRLYTRWFTPPDRPGWLQVEVHAQAAEDDYRIVAAQKVRAPFATGRMEVVEPRLGRSLHYECAAAVTPSVDGGVGEVDVPARSVATGSVARIAFVGDVMLAESEATGRLLAAGGDPFAQVREMLAAADLRVANFESSAGRTGRPDPDKPYSFRTAHAALLPFGRIFEAASLANNHAGDYGRTDFAETLAALQAVGVRPFGGGLEPAQAHQPVFFQRQGVTVALLGYLDFLPRWFAVAPDLPGAAWLDPDLAAQDIARARAAGADVVVVVPHWGMEDEPRANQRQRRLARALIDAGADAVIGGHPHVVQDHEIHRGKPIVYSLGNFVFDGFSDEENLTGWVLFADVDKQGVRSLTTRVVHLDALGSPVPNSDKAGPCWQRGEAAMLPCR